MGKHISVKPPAAAYTMPADCPCCHLHESYVCCRPREGGDPGFEWYRALCARPQKLIAVPRTAGGFLFFVRAKKRNQKKARPDGAFSCAPRLWDPALGQRVIPSAWASRAHPCARPLQGARPKPCGARVRHGGFEQHLALPRSAVMVCMHRPEKGLVAVLLGAIPPCSVRTLE